MLFNDEFAFIHFPKTAGKSLTKYMIAAWNDPIHALVTPGQVEEIADVVRPGVQVEVARGHENIRRTSKILQGMGRRIEDLKAVFVCIRNPYDLAVSTYFFMREHYERNTSSKRFKMAAEMGFEQFWCNDISGRAAREVVDAWRACARQPEVHPVRVAQRRPRRAGSRIRLSRGGTPALEPHPAGALLRIHDSRAPRKRSISASSTCSAPGTTRASPSTDTVPNGPNVQVFVLGMHRSGTSAVARVLNLLGCYFGSEDIGTRPNQENPKGFWERRDVRQVNDAILQNADCDWDRVSSFDIDSIGDGDRAVYGDEIANIVLNLDGHRPWFVKEPRCCLTFALWRECLEMPFCVFAFRNPYDVARSLHARNDVPLEVGLALWELYNVRALAASEGLPRAFVAYETLMTNPQAFVHRFVESATEQGYSLRAPQEAELSAFLEDGLRHFRADQEQDRGVSDGQADLFEMLRAAEVDAGIATDRYPVAQASLDLLAEYERNLPSALERAADANASAIRRQQVTTSTELALKRLELANVQAALAEASKEARRWRQRARARQRPGRRADPASVVEPPRRGRVANQSRQADPRGWRRRADALGSKTASSCRRQRSWRRPSATWSNSTVL